MFYEVEVPYIVHKDITNLVEYVYRFSFSKQIAENIHSELHKAMFSLEFLPNRYEIHIGEYRRVIVKGSYKIIYRVDEESKKVIIIRVIRSEQEENIV